MTYDKEKLKYYISFVVEKYYARFNFLHNESLDYWKEKAYEKYLDSSLSPEGIAKDIAQKVELMKEAEERNKLHAQQAKNRKIEEIKKEVTEEKKNDLDSMFQEKEEDLDNTLTGKITITNEKPKVYVKNNTNKGFGVFLSFIIGILVVISMVLVTLISYTIIK